MTDRRDTVLAVANKPPPVVTPLSHLEQAAGACAVLAAGQPLGGGGPVLAPPSPKSPDEKKAGTANKPKGSQ